MNEIYIRFGLSQTQARLITRQGFEFFFDEGIHGNIQQFVDHVPDLNPNEPFYFGFWRMVIRKIEGVYYLCEWDYEGEEFTQFLERSLCLWHAQRGVFFPQELPWTSVGAGDYLHFTPSVFLHEQESTIEGVRDKNNVLNGSGWILYTDSDRNENLDFDSMPLHEALKIFNTNVLRFLCLPDGWTFNINVSGESHIWEEGLA